MLEYALYLESGPPRKTTMVHVIDLLGCTCRAATTESALEAAPSAIQSYREYLWDHGEELDPDEEYELRVEQHVTGGGWTGHGDPAPGFRPDYEPLTPGDLHRYRRWLGWMHADLLEYAGNLPAFILEAEPEQGRPLYRVFEHMAESEVRCTNFLLGPSPRHTAALKQVAAGPSGLYSGLVALFCATETRLEALSAADLVRLVAHGQDSWSARRMMRRLLEHAWEHLQEIQRRLDNP